MLNDYQAEHESVFNEATNIFRKRSEVRGQMWMEFPPSDKLREIRERLTRLEHGYQEIRFEDTTPGPEDPFHQIKRVLEEDALDLLNYCNFFIKQLRRGQRG
jgi:hypothetical protein